MSRQKLASLCLVATSALLIAALCPARASAQPGTPTKEPAEKRQPDNATACVDGVTVAAPAGPCSLSLTGSLDVGLFFATHGKLTLAVGRTFWDRLSLEAALRLDSGEEFYGVEETMRLGVLLHLSLHWRMLLAWRLGHAHLLLVMPGRDRWVGVLETAFEPELQWQISPHLALRLVPAALSGYWSEVWGGCVETSAGIAYRF